MLHTIISAWFLSYNFILLYEAVYLAWLRLQNLNYFTKIALSACQTLSGLFYYTASGLMGAFIIFYLNPPQVASVGRFEASCAILAFIWLAGLWIQISLNVIRRLTNTPPQPIRYVNRRLFFWLP